MTTPRKRTRRSAKAAGTSFERLIADTLATHIDDRIDRRAKTGAKDKGDIGGLRTPAGSRVVVECKDTARVALAGWAAEAEVERVNDGAVAGLVVHKRTGKGAGLEQWVTMTVADLIALLTDTRPGPVFIGADCLNTDVVQIESEATR
ncbi:holliday junction resolvase [Gordonia phage Jojo24]|uniref:Holliday junction resolvase n=1 Tax=Gordonia phage Jojo24 TaxID=2859476 RepID=A0AAE7SP08_9CAUD|nr:holliday junction resolvase [Gordonia phage Jojo24]QXO13153.1 holliday junction resolvase [Gordonia phage Jojo24]